MTFLVVSFGIIEQATS